MRGGRHFLQGEGPPRREQPPSSGDPLGGTGHDPGRRATAHEGGPHQAPPPPRSRGFDLAALFVLLDAVRRAVPDQLERQLTALIREFLLTLRALIDWYLERLDGGRREPEVEDIPID